MPATVDLLRSNTPPQNIHQTQPSVIVLSSNKKTETARYKSTSQGMARFEQTKIMSYFSSKKISSRSITQPNVISREGLKAVLGKVSTMSNLKDGTLRLFYRISHKNAAASSEVGGTHRSLIRLAGDYHTLSQNPQPTNLDRRNELLDLIKSKVSDLISKHSVTKGDSERTKVIDLKVLDKFLTEEKNAIYPSDVPEQPQVEVPDAPLRPNIPEFTTYQSPVKTKGDSLEEVIMKINVEKKEEGEKMGEVNIPEAPSRPKVLEFQPNNLRVATRGNNLEEVTKNLTAPDDYSYSNSMPWAKQEFDLKTIEDFHALDFTENQPQLQPRKNFADIPLNDLPGFSLKSSEYKEIESQICNAIQSNGGNDHDAQERTGKLLGQMLGRCIAQHMGNMQEMEKRDFLTSFYTSDRNSIFGPILKHIGIRYPKFKEHFQDANRTMLQLRRVFNAACGEIHTFLPDKCNDEGNEITLNNVKYRRVDDLGEGGVATVSIYQEVTDKLNPERIVVKRSQGENSENVQTKITANKQLANESRMHASLSTNLHVVGFQGVVRTPEGGVLLAMKLAPLGDVSKMMAKLKDAENSGLISHEAANAVRITLFKDMVKGVQQLQDNLGVVHLDLKMQNFFIKEDGMAQMGDFGLTVDGLSTSVTELKLDAEYNKAPELTLGQDISNFREQAIVELRNTEKNESKHPGFDKAGEKENEKNAIQIDTKADVYALGTAAYEMFTGRKFISDLTDGGGWIKEFDALRDYGLNPDRTATTLGLDKMPPEEKKNNPNVVQEKPISVGRGVTAMDRVFNAMLHPDKDQRPDMRDLLKFSVFDQPGIQETHVRDLIKLLGNPETSPEQLKVASRNVGF